MLEKLDMKKKLSKGNYNEIMDVLGERLGQVQRMAREAKKPIIIVFEGWRGARRSAIINTMMQQMDARCFDVYSTLRMSEEEHTQPFFTLFWQHLPAGWRTLVLSSHTEFERTFGRPADKKRKLYNGMLKCDLFMYGNV